MASKFSMNLVFIVAAVLVLPGFGVADAARLVSEAQAPAVPEKNPQPPAQDAAGASEGAEQSAAGTEKESPPEKEVAAPSAEKPATGAPAPSAAKRRSRKKKVAPTPGGEPRKVVIHHGGASEPTAEILPGITPEEAKRQRESSEQLLEASELSLSKLAGRSLDPIQQEMVVQIRQYVEDSRSAMKSDTQRAHTLALKAYLLADDLVKHEK